MRALPRRVLYLVLVTVALALPAAVVGALDASRGRVPLDLGLLLFLFATLLSLRPIRVLPNTELSPSDIAVLTAIVLLPPGAVALVAGLARLATDVLTRKRPIQMVRNTAAVIVAAGAAAVAYRLTAGAMIAGVEAAAAAAIGSGLVAVVVLVAMDIGQIVLLQRALGTATDGERMRLWIGRTVSAQLLWDLAAVITLQVVLIEPWFLLPALPFFVFGYLEIRARFAAERRARLLATLVEVGHAVGMSLDPVQVFREVFSQIRRALDVDSFYVAIADPDRGLLSFRYLYEDGQEMAPRESPIEGTLAGLTVERGRPLLVRDTESDRARLDLPPRSAWGTLLERSLIVVPLRLQGRAIGALSVQSVRRNAYDEGDLELLSAIANEAAIAIQRADLYERATALSRRLFDLHRLSVELAQHKELVALERAFATSVQSLTGASAVALYLDTGGDRIEFSYSTGNTISDALTLPKSSPPIARAIESGEGVVLHDRDGESQVSRKLLRRFGRRTVFIQPLRAADRLVAVLFVTWSEQHAVGQEERELFALLGGIGASHIRGIGLYQELDDAYLSTVSTLTATIEARDQYREDHQRRVAADAVALGERLAFGEEQLRDLRYASLFHAIGKIAVPPALLAKRGPLTPEERAIVEEYPILGARILESIRFLRGVVPVVRAGRERYDGSGYPDRLAGEAIPRAARVLRIVVDYHAMLVDRPYRGALRPEAALAELRRLAGMWYDPAMVEEFATMIEARGAIQAVEEDVGATSRELAILAELTPEFHSLLDLQQLLDRILQILERNIPGASFTILLKDEKTDQLVVRAAAGAWRTIDSPKAMPAGRGIASWVLEHRESQNVEDVRTDPRYVGDPEVRSELVVPLLSAGRGIGALVLSHRTVAAFSQRDLMLMQTVGAQIAAAIDVAELHERLKRAANTDALTGLHNYRYFYDRLEEEIARAERHQAPLAVAFFDLDRLKTVNDTYGHTAGNEVLRTLGERISTHVRTEDVPARYGGDEFAIVMPETPREEAEKVVERLMDILDHTDVPLPDGRVIKMPELSWGIASYPLDGRTARALVENADTRAYARKRSR